MVFELYAGVGQRLGEVPAILEKKPDKVFDKMVYGE